MPERATHNVVPLRRTHELDAHVMPDSKGNTSGSLWVDFLTFWHIWLPTWLSRVDWVEVGFRLVIAVCLLAISTSILALAMAYGWIDAPYLADLLGLPHN